VNHSLPLVTLFTDGGCSGNPGPGGYGIVLASGPHRKELSGGYRLTTNNRMELMGVITGLTALKKRSRVTIVTDSRYVAEGITKGWAARWRANGWMKNKKEAASNPDLWETLLDLCARHDVTFEWVKGHAGHAENERCDELAVSATQKSGLPADIVYETAKSRVLTGARESAFSEPFSQNSLF
jgi:ribonuclease HI